MRWFLLSIVLVVAVSLLVPHPAAACPACKDAVAASSDSGDPDEDSGGSPAAYNHSIYLMIGVPYLSLAVVFFLIYRGLKKNAEYLRTHGKPCTATHGSPVLP